jgi:phage terminase small subunit
MKQNEKNKSIDQLIQDHLWPEHAIDPVVVKFIYGYLETRHVGDAAKAAGVAKHTGLRIFNKPDIQQCLKEINKTLAREHSFDASEILERANEVMQFNIQDIFNPNGTVKDIHDIPPKAARVIKKLKIEETWEEDMNGIKIQTGRIIQIDFWDKLKATELLGKFEGVFKDTVKHELGMDGNLAAVLLAQAENRAIEMSREIHPVVYTPKLIGDPTKDNFTIEASKVELDE